MVDEVSDEAGVPWERSTVPPEHQLLGLGPIELTVPDIAPTADVVELVLGLTELRRYSQDGVETVVFGRDDLPGPHAELHIRIEPSLAAARPGAGGVHHVAFRVRDYEYDAWSQKLRAMRIPNSGPVDRYYFRSLYFREPNGILFELATDGPGFAVDEDPSTLGEDIALPPFLEPRREAIVARLKPID